MITTAIAITIGVLFNLCGLAAVASSLRRLTIEFKTQRSGAE